MDKGSNGNENRKCRGHRGMKEKAQLQDVERWVEKKRMWETGKTGSILTDQMKTDKRLKS